MTAGLRACVSVAIGPYRIVEGQVASGRVVYEAGVFDRAYMITVGETGFHPIPTWASTARPVRSGCSAVSVTRAALEPGQSRLAPARRGWL